MKRKISLFLVLVCAFWSCAGALADGFLSPGSSEVTAAFDAAGLKYSQLDISNSGDVFRISYAPATSTQLDSIVVTIHVMESSATVLGPSIGDIDASIVTDHMMLAATSLGLDTLWICMFKPEAVREEFSLPPHVEPVNILLIGYGDGIPADPDRHDTLRKPLDETVFYEKF